MTVNVIFAVSETTWNLLKQNYQRDADGNRLRNDLTNAQLRKLRTTVAEFWTTPTLAGTVYHVASWYVPNEYVVDEDPASGLKWVEFLTNKYPNKFHVIGAWNKNGTMFGTELTYDINGNEVITGAPVYPLHAQYMKIFPDVDGVPATVPAEVNKLCGWTDRRWV